MRMQKLGHIAAALALAAGVIYFVTVPKDDEKMVRFKETVATFIRSGKQSTTMRKVLGGGWGDKICVKYGVSDSMEITIQDYKVLTVMKGRRDIVVDGKSYTFIAGENKQLLAQDSPDCFNYARARITKDGEILVLSGEVSTAVEKRAIEKTKQKKKPAPAPEKKKPVQRSYGY
jgi:hypothetical protein